MDIFEMQSAFWKITGTIT